MAYLLNLIRVLFAVAGGVEDPYVAIRNKWYRTIILFFKWSEQPCDGGKIDTEKMDSYAPLAL